MHTVRERRTGHLEAIPLSRPKTCLAQSIKLNFKFCRVNERTIFIIRGIFELFSQQPLLGCHSESRFCY